MGWREFFGFKPKGQAAAAVSSTRNFDSNEGRRADRRVSEAWNLWRLVGELHYVTTQQARLVGRLDWTMTVNGTEIESDQADQIWRAGFGSPAQVRHLQVTAALHYQVAGGYFLARVGGLGGKWEILPNPANTKVKKKLDRSDIVIIVENPDPEDPDTRLDSAVLASLDTARELLLARQQSRAATRSRTAQLNTLIYPLEGAGPDPKQFEDDLIEVMVAPLSDEFSTSTVVPNMIGFPNEYIENLKALPLVGPIDEKIQDRIERLVAQLAVMLDIPVELLTGMGDANHWTAWLVAEDNWLSNVEPMASPIGEGFAQAFEMMLNQPGAEATDVEIEPDPAPLLKRRPTIENALAAAELGIVNEEWTLEQIGASPEDAGPGLLQMQAAKAQARRQPVAIEGDPVANGDQPAVQEPGAVAAADPVAIETSPEPQAPTAVDTDRLANLDVEFNELMQDLVADAADRSLERLGARLRSAAQQSKLELPDVPNQQVAIAYKEPIENQAQVVTDTASKFEPQFDRFVQRAFRKLKLAGLAMNPRPSEVADAFTAFLAEVGTVVEARRAGKPGNAEAWMGAKRVNALLGGNPDPKVLPVVSSSGVQTTPRGIALGIRALEILNEDYGLISDEWIWHHAYSGSEPHPMHVSLEGKSIRPGGTILENGVNWYPGDHAGCQCLVVPVLRRNR